MVQIAIQKHELTEAEQAAIGKLLTETLAGEISQDTMDAVRKLDLEHIAGPYRHMIYYSDTDNDGKRWARTLQDELRIVCMELLEPS
jgi:hypothetical protein